MILPHTLTLSYHHLTKKCQTAVYFGLWDKWGRQICKETPFGITCANNSSMWSREWKYITWVSEENHRLCLKHWDLTKYSDRIRFCSQCYHQMRFIQFYFLSKNILATISERGMVILPQMIHINVKLFTDSSHLLCPCFKFMWFTRDCIT